MGALQRELKLLSDAGIIRRSVQGKHVYYRTNPDCPVFEELKGLVVKTFGVSDVLRTGLSDLAERIIVAFVFGSPVRGVESESSDVDIMAVGNVTFTEVVSAVSPVQETLGREINPTVYPETEYACGLAGNERDSSEGWLAHVFSTCRPCKLRSRVLSTERN